MIRPGRLSVAWTSFAAVFLAFAALTAPAHASPDACVSPPPPPVGGVYPGCAAGNVPSGTTCVLTCANGYAKTGTDPQCFLGAYVGTGNDCVPATCAPLSGPVGSSSNCGSAPTGSTCTMSCDPGYTQDGTGAMTCVGIGVGTSVWQGPLTTCVPNPCPLPPTPPLGGAYQGCLGPNVPSGTTCTLVCATGYTKTGSDPQCDRGAFAGGTNDCVPATCAPLSGPAGSSSDCGSAPTGSTCTVGCNAGYTQDGSGAMTCLGTGTGTSVWQGPTTSCTANACASPPTPPTNGSYPDCSSGPVPNGTTCALACAAGYTKTGTDPQCSLGALTGTGLNDCVPATCAPLSGPVGGSSNCGSAPTGSACTVSCNPGYTQDGSGAKTCVGTGAGASAWQGPPTSCVANACASPPTPPVGGSYPPCSGGSVPSGTTCTLTCADGYTKTGTDPHCSLGALTGTGANGCVAATCAPLPDPVGGSSNCGAATTGNTCTVSCDPGYTKMGTDPLCVGTGVGISHWQDSASCVPITCGPTPAVGCRPPTASRKSILTLKDSTANEKDQLQWSWGSGAATTLAELGDPTATESYYLCLYDGGALRSSTQIPAGGMCGKKPCWKASAHGFQYKKSKDLGPDGVAQLTLKDGIAGKAKIQIKGKGLHLEMPVLGSVLLGPVTVQLHRASAAVCWEATYGAPFLKNDGTKFKDKSD